MSCPFHATKTFLLYTIPKNTSTTKQSQTEIEGHAKPGQWVKNYIFEDQQQWKDQNALHPKER